MKQDNSISGSQEKESYSSSSLENAKKVAAYLAHPFLDIAGDSGVFSQDEINALYNFLRKNRVIFRTLDSNVSTTELSTKKRFIEEIIQRNGFFAQAYDFVHRLRQKIVEVTKAMTESGVDVIFIKAVNNFPMDSHNFDILVKEQELAKAREILERIGFKEIGRLHEPFKWFYRRIDNDMVVSIHLHTRVAWVGIEFIDCDDVWKKHRKMEISGVKVGFPSLEHCLLTTAAHGFFENQGLKLCDILEMTEVFRSSGSVDWNYIVELGTRDHWFKAFYAFLQLANHAYKSFYGEKLVEDEIIRVLEEKGHVNGDGSVKKLIERFDKRKRLPVKLPVTTVTFSFIDKVFKTSSMSFLGKIRKVSSVGLSYVTYRMPLRRELPAFLICFSGQDGSGKTTHAESLRNDLVRTIQVMNDDIMEKNLRVNYVWSRGIGLTLDPLMRMIRPLMFSDKSPRVAGNSPRHERERETWLRLKPIKLLWAYSTLVDELLQLLIKIKIPLFLRQQQTVVCDRYVYDTLVDIECGLNQHVSRVMEKITTDLSPKPSMVFILDAEPAELAKRKKDLKCRIMECKRKKYLALLDGTRFNVIDTRKDLQQNKKEILSRVLENLLI